MIEMSYFHKRLSDCHSKNHTAFMDWFRCWWEMKYNSGSLVGLIDPWIWRDTKNHMRQDFTSLESCCGNNDFIFHCPCTYLIGQMSHCVITVLRQTTELREKMQPLIHLNGTTSKERIIHSNQQKSLTWLKCTLLCNWMQYFYYLSRAQRNKRKLYKIQSQI